MCANGYFTEIYHFKETPLFEKVTASFIIFKFVKSKQKKDTFTLYRYNKEKGLPTSDELANRSCFDVFTIPHFKENSRWILATEEVQNKLNRFEEACVKPSATLFETELYRIGDYCDIGNGMVSGLDAAFQIKDTSELNKDEAKALITVLKAKDLCAYKNKSSTKYIFLQEEISTEKFEIKYPHFAEHFNPNLEKLAKIYSYNRSIPYWEFVFPRNQKLFERKEARISIPCKILYCDNGFYDLIDVKTRNRGKTAMAPNIISAYKLARMCALMIDNEENENINIDYIEMDWIEDGANLKCTDAHHGDLFKANPEKLYINWAAAMQIQFHVCDLDQSWKGTREEWARYYLKVFVTSAEHRCQKMREMYIIPFLKYL